jgi:hypothetical protein
LTSKHQTIRVGGEMVTPIGDNQYGTLVPALFEGWMPCATK